MSFKIMEAVRKGKVKKGGFQEGWVEAMQEHNVPQWYIDSLAKIGYLFPKAHAVAICHDGLPHRMVQGPPAAGLLRHLLHRPGQGLRRRVLLRRYRRREQKTGRSRTTRMPPLWRRT